MEYLFRYLNGRPQIFLDTGERFYPSEPLPKDHLFEAGLNFSPMLDCDPNQLLLKPVNAWFNAIPDIFANKVITHLIKMGRLIRFGSASLIVEEPQHVDWSVDEEGYTETSITLASMFVDLSEEIGDFDGLLNSMERFICEEIGTGRMSDNITELPLFDKNILFTEKQMFQLSALTLFFKMAIPISNTYYSTFVMNVSPIRRPWIVLAAPFMELIESYCPELIRLLRQHVRKNLICTSWASQTTIALETEFQFTEFLLYALPFIDLYSADLKIINSVLDVFSGR